MIEQLIAQATSQLDIDADTAKLATGGLMNLIKEQAGDETFGKLANAIPGTKSMLRHVGSSSDVGGGGLMGALSSLAGGNVMGAMGGLMSGQGGIAGAVGALATLGLDSQKSQGFLQLAMQFIQSNAGEAVLDELKAKLPFLAELLD